PLTDFRGKTSIFSHPVYLFLRKFSLQDSRGGSCCYYPTYRGIGNVHVPRISNYFAINCGRSNNPITD
ncbi:hypothetical protein C6513_22980, partial [Escherichia coli]|nr:hypothetical protein [Escherichia coli]NYW18375.1 hypothetical protein [Escherichia coli]